MIYYSLVGLIFNTGFLIMFVHTQKNWSDIDLLRAEEVLYAEIHQNLVVEKSGNSVCYSVKHINGVKNL